MYRDLTGERFGKLLVLVREGSKSKFAYWRCRCDCGTEKVIRGVNLTTGRSASCGCVHKHDLTGCIFSKLTVLKLESNTDPVSHNRYWLCRCDCGTVKKIPQSHLTGKRVRSCGCQQFPLRSEHPAWKGCGEFSGTFFNTIRSSAKTRGLEFSISKEYIWGLFLKQNRKCALTGMDLKFASNWKVSDGTASLDRIDNLKGYLEGNVWWVHKDINLMKNTFTIEQFRAYCKRVSEIAENEHSLRVT